MGWVGVGGGDDRNLYKGVARWVDGRDTDADVAYCRVVLKARDVKQMIFRIKREGN